MAQQQTPQQPLPPANRPWIDPKTGNPTQIFYQFMTGAFPLGVDLQVRLFRNTPLLFAQLPKPFVLGMMAVIGDSQVSVPGNTISGLGRLTVLGLFNGTNWVVV
jgi:hypothetical protein